MVEKIKEVTNCRNCPFAQFFDYEGLFACNLIVKGIEYSSKDFEKEIIFVNCPLKQSEIVVKLK